MITLAVLRFRKLSSKNSNEPRWGSRLASVRASNRDSSRATAPEMQKTELTYDLVAFPTRIIHEYDHELFMSH